MLDALKLFQFCYCCPYNGLPECVVEQPLPLQITFLRLHYLVRIAILHHFVLERDAYYGKGAYLESLCNLPCGDLDISFGEVRPGL